MKVCMATRYFDFRNAGIGRVSSSLASGVEAQGHNVTKVSTEGRGLVPYFKYVFFDLGVRFRLSRDGYDIYHALTPMESFWMPKDTCVVTFYDFIPILNPDRGPTGMNKNALNKLIGMKCFGIGCKAGSKASFACCISEDTRRLLVEHYRVPEEKTKTIRLGIQDDLEPKERTDSKFRVGYLGQLDRRKRVDLLLEAFLASGLDELVIGGTGPERKSLEAMAKGDSRVKFLGRVLDEQLPNFYASLDLFGFPTWAEGYGLPPVEAMACKVPTIVLQDSLMPSDVKNRCIIVDHLGIALGNRKYLKGRMTAIDTKSNYKFAKEHNWNNCVNEYIKVYKEVIWKQ